MGTHEGILLKNGSAKKTEPEQEIRQDRLSFMLLLEFILFAGRALANKSTVPDKYFISRWTMLDTNSSDQKRKWSRTETFDYPSGLEDDVYYSTIHPKNHFLVTLLDID